MAICRLIFFLNLLALSMSDIIESRFAIDYFADRNIPHIAVFACWNPYDRAIFSRSLMNNEKSVTYAEINDNLAMGKILKVNYYKLGIFVDLDCDRSEIIFDQFTDQQLRYNESYWWLIVTRKKAISKNFFEKLPLNIATEMTIASRQNDTYELHDVYNPSSRHGGRVNVTFMGNWSKNDGCKIVLTQYKYKRRGDLHGLPLNFSIAVDHQSGNDLTTYISNPINRHYDTMHRFNYALMTQLRDFYNFTMNLKRGTTWGYLVNGSWNGILGDMAKGLVDVSVTPFNYRKDRLEVTDYTVQTFLIRVVVIFRHPQKNDLTNVFFKPFTNDVWQLIVIVAIVNWSLLYMTVKIEQHYDWREPINTLDTNPASETALITAASICQQGLSDGPRIYSGRIIFLFLFLWALLMFQFYSASVVGSLLIEKPRFINTAEDLLESNLDLGAEDIAYNHDLFQNSDIPIIRRLFNKKMALNKKRKNLPFYSAKVGMKKVQNGGFALHIDATTAYKFIEETFTENEICDLAEIYLLLPRHTSTCTSKHSPFKKMVTYGLRLIMERGSPTHLRNVWNHRRPECPESHGAMPVPVVIQEFSPAIFTLLFGIGLSLFVMIIEKFIYWRNEKRKINFTENEKSIDPSIDLPIDETILPKSC